jgi:hypothetical protein
VFGFIKGSDFVCIVSEFFYLCAKNGLPGFIRDHHFLLSRVGLAEGLTDEIAEIDNSCDPFFATGERQIVVCVEDGLCCDLGD